MHAALDSNLDTPDREIVGSRLLNAPGGSVFQAWVDPEHLANWW